MTGTFAGLDLNGLADCTLHLGWPDREAERREVFLRPDVIEVSGKQKHFLVGQDAARHPGGRGWGQPRWASDVVRHPVASLLAGLGGDRGDSAMPALIEHLRHLGRDLDQAGFVIADDLPAEAQTLLLEASRRATRFSSQGKWRGWTATPIWRSVAALLGWAQDVAPENLRALNGGQVLCLSLLPDRLTAARFTLDLHEDAGGPLLTPVRSEAGCSLGVGAFPPEMLEQRLLEQVESAVLRDQLVMIGAGATYAKGGTPDTLLQDRNGRWCLPPEIRVPDDMRRQAVKAFRALLATAPDENIDFILVETPDPERGFHDRSWASLAFGALRADRPRTPIALAQPHAAARGAAEYGARLANDLPTFFDHLPQIEVVAEVDGKPQFIPLFPKQTRIPGNKPFREILPGRFGVPAGTSNLNFHLFKDDEDGTRHAHADLPFAPQSDVPIALHVEQRPVSGHAVIEVVPGERGALGPVRIMLDWRRMEQTGETREETIARLDVRRPSWPDYGPTETHWAVWEVAGIEHAMERFLRRPPTRSDHYSKAVHALLGALQKQINPARENLGSLNEKRRPFDSEGHWPPDRHGGDAGRSTLVREVKQKLGDDLQALTPYKPGETLIRRLSLCGAWMFGGAPDETLGYLRRVMRGEFNDRYVIDGIGRAVRQEDDIRAAFGRLHAGLERRRRDGDDSGVGAASDELKSAASILRYRENAGRLLTPSQALMIAGSALRRIHWELHGREPLALNFLWAASAFLLVLRYREIDSSFFAPPANGEPPSQGYAAAERVLVSARESIGKGRRRHQHVPETIDSALGFLQKTGGNPDIIKVIGNSLD